MPVVDHPVHEKTKQKEGHPYGCHNRKPFAKDYFAPDRVYRPDGAFYTVLKRIEFTMSKDCNYDLSDKDKQCAGCSWRRGSCDE